MSFQTSHGYTVPSGDDPIAQGADDLAANALQLEEKVKLLDSGQAIVTPSAANVNTSKRVNFNFEFPAPPHVVVAANSGVIVSTVKGVAVQDIDTTGFTVWVNRTNTTNTAVEWIAHG